MSRVPLGMKTASVFCRVGKVNPTFLTALPSCVAMVLLEEISGKGCGVCSFISAQRSSPTSLKESSVSTRLDLTAADTHS